MKPGDRFGRLRVVSVLSGTEAGRPGDGSYARCRCDCGAFALARTTHLRHGQRKSCGGPCASDLRSEAASERHRSRGFAPRAARQ